MPLSKSSSKQAISLNIRELLASGKPKDQAIAIALDVARRARRLKTRQKKKNAR